MSRAIHAHRDELIELAIANGGNTRGDAKFDIDGASGTLAAYAELGKSSATRTFLVDGDGDAARPLARASSASTSACRARASRCTSTPSTSRRGASRRRRRCALLAGMPVITKPATSTALVAHRIDGAPRRGEAPARAARSRSSCGAPGDLLDAPRRAGRARVHRLERHRREAARRCPNVVARRRCASTSRPTA